MSRWRRLAESALAKMDELGEKENAKALARLSPAEREHHDAWVERTEHFRTTGELRDGKLVGKALLGPAGRVLAGVVTPPKTPEALPAGAQRDAVARAEREARAAARMPYRAPDAPGVVFTRFATSPRGQGAEVVATLAATGFAGRPDLVYGVYRVPDLVGPGLGGEQVVEWEIVHAPAGELPPAPPPADVVLDARARWVGRRVGEAAPLDEELALAYLVRAGIGPERTLGIARHAHIRHQSGNDQEQSLVAQVTGVHVLHPGPVAPAFAELEAAAPIALPEPAGVHVARLNWEAIAKAVAPVRRRLEPVPSPWAYLPLTAPELIAAYLEVVGVRPGDSYGAQVTYGQPYNLINRSTGRGFLKVYGGGDDFPCADGTPRKRVLGGTQVVIAYRDRPEHAAGRERWAAYEREVLQAELWRSLSGREPVPKPTHRLLRAAERISDVINTFDTDYFNGEDEIPPRYCWPPVDA